MLSQLRTAVVPPTTSSITRPPRPPPPPSQSHHGSQLSPLAPAPVQHPHLVNGHTNGALTNWTSINNQDPYTPNSDAMPTGPPWTDAEKISLLVEILRDCEVVAPNWRNITIPPGRTSLQAQQIFAMLTASPENSPATSPAAPVAAPPPPPPPQPQPQPAASGRKRGNASAAASAATPIKRKRGRPSKADMALREQLSQSGAPAAATWQPQMYTPDHGRGGVSMLATPAGATPSLGAIQQQLSELPPLKKKRGRPTKAEMEARRERQRLELLAAQRIHGGDLPSDIQDLDDQARQKHEQDQAQQQMRDQENERTNDSGNAHEEVEEDESEEGGPDSPDTEE
ncbi:hypothetical protein FN846DRAFT_957733 [Sphaerosporella brunnea]|uniref:Myb-like domain-containing protein n=1 Tax=Sphaerosporella brunnea TaxID=1250544 RepID=A0A5J5ERZ1_9PEZI|nr:hypothetical protein FN846DRAFT_957733 [Sphaerosporella brunnea]